MPGMYFDKSTDIDVVTHVDDFLVVSCETVLKKFHSALLEEFGLTLRRQYVGTRCERCTRVDPNNGLGIVQSRAPLRIAKTPKMCYRTITKCRSMKCAYTEET